MSDILFAGPGVRIATVGSNAGGDLAGTYPNPTVDSLENLSNGAIPAGVLLTAPGTWQWAMRDTDSDGVVSSTVLVDDGVLQFTAEDTADYRYYAEIWETASAPGGARETITAPAGAEGGISWLIGGSAGASAHFAFGVELPHGADLVILMGRVKTTGTGGLVKVRYAQAASDGTATKHLKNSFIMAWRIA